MGESDRRCGVFYDKATRWSDELAALRAILLSTPLDEAFKWRQPVYTYHGANVCIVWAMKETVGVGFLKGVLLKDPGGLLKPPGDNSRSAMGAYFTALDQIAAAESALRDLVAQAIANEDAGKKVVFEPDDLPLPDELVAALADDADLSAAWDNLTPGRRRGYVLAVGQAKQPQTRIARIAKHRERILKGLGLHDR